MLESQMTKIFDSEQELFRAEMARRDTEKSKKRKGIDGRAQYETGSWMSEEN